MDLTRACSGKEEDEPSVVVWAVKVRVESVLWPPFSRPPFSFDFNFVLWHVLFDCWFSDFLCFRTKASLCPDLWSRVSQPSPFGLPVKAFPFGGPSKGSDARRLFSAGDNFCRCVV
ncbi:hypothetical protein V6N13_095342 [Hibiscus sabdariffa]